MSRRKQILPRTFIPYFDRDNPEQVEDHFRRLLMLFKPWENEKNLREQHSSYEESYRAFVSSLPEEAKTDIERFEYESYY